MTLDEAASISAAYAEHETINAIFASEVPGLEREDDEPESVFSLTESVADAAGAAIADLLDEVTYGASSSQTVIEHEAIKAIIRQVAGVAASSLTFALTERQARLAHGIADAASTSVNLP